MIDMTSDKITSEVKSHIESELMTLYNKAMADYAMAVSNLTTIGNRDAYRRHEVRVFDAKIAYYERLIKDLDL